MLRCSVVLKSCLNLTARDSCLVVTDRKRLKLANKFYLAAKKITKKSSLLEIKELDISGQEPSTCTADIMKKYKVILLITTKSLSHTKATYNAAKAGARIASMPGITESIAERTLNIDYKKMNLLNKKLMDLFRKSKKITIKTARGTLIHAEIPKILFNDNGNIWQIRVGNLPAGEVCFAPIKTNGTYVIDGSIEGVGRIGINTIKVKVDKNIAIRISGGKNARKLSSIIKKHGRKARNIAEIGIGTNPKASINGNTLEDEKVLGTVHIALGNNRAFGGKCNVPVHLDGIIKNPTIHIDANLIMENGKLLI